MANLNITKLVLDKDSWENIPPMVFKSFQATNANMNAVKKWAEYYEGRTKSQTDSMTKIEEKVLALEGSIGVLREQMVSGEDHRSDVAEELRQHADNCASTFQRMAWCMGIVFSQIGQTFGLQRETEEEVEGSGDRQPAPLGVLMAPEGLERDVEMIQSAFERWRELQAADQLRHASVQSCMQDLSRSVDESHEKIAACNEIVQDSVNANESLKNELEKTGAAVLELQSLQVKHDDVESAVQRKGEELETLHRMTEQSVERLGRGVEDHLAEVQRLVADISRQTDERIADHSNQVSRMVEGHMNPLNAYLNTMHVKTDAMRVDVDKLKDKAPELKSRIEAVVTQLQDLEEAHRGTVSQLHAAVDAVNANMEAHSDRHIGHHNELSGSVKDMFSALTGRLAELQAFADTTAESLELVKREDLSGLARELLSLDQKVAKWVHSNPLPAKISEARLYSLEARLSDEMDARIALECKVRKTITPRMRDDTADLVLPQLSQELSQGFARGRKPSGDRR
ncbi:unnamed protein product [Effrenium voratum]|uniref:Uncharacterized protein n=1 Tax=Effrenium voratum TaxID=2562239 RepID=A0AA36HX96_9DINO|nr:unnamed protein product [Effrenium voratum]CAJ1422588.1 unnamed protein product [Effrenium voratum]